MYVKEELLAKLETLETKLGRLPSRREMRSLGGVHESVFLRVFGSWSDALRYYEQTQLAPKTAPKIKPKEVKDGLLEELAKNLSKPELEALVASTRHKTEEAQSQEVITTGYFKAVICTDSHIGHKKFNPVWWKTMIDHAVAAGCQFGWHAGDILEGMSGRPGHVFELDRIGFEAQFEQALEMFEYSPLPWRCIIGNHDEWYAGKGDIGINVGKRLQESLSNYTHLGNQEADDVIAGIKVKLWHGIDGSSYATSYRSQKFVENLAGGDKPHILITGHDHKSLFYHCRNVAVIGGGTMCAQTGWMRGKKLAAHTGYWIVEVWTNEQGLARIRPEWNPFY